MINVLNLTKSYPLFNGGRHYVFKDFTFEFSENCSIGLMGRNVEGKLTLMNLLNGYGVDE